MVKKDTSCTADWVSYNGPASFPSCTKEESLVVRLAGTATLCPPLIIDLATVARTSPRLTRRITLRPLWWPCASVGVALHRSNPREARRASRGTCVDFFQGEGISLGDGRTACLSRQSSVLSTPRGPFPRGLPRRLCLGLSRIRLPNITGLATDRSMGTLVPTGPTLSLVATAINHQSPFYHWSRHRDS